MTTIDDIPDDLNGQALRNMLESGDDLSKPRDFDFTVVFPDGGAAAAFAQRFKDRGYSVNYERTATAEGLPWDVVVVNFMIPDHAAIAAFEQELQAEAEPLGGRNDGWGCFERAGPEH